MLENIKNIEKSFKSLRNVAFASVAASLLISTAAIFTAFKTYQSGEEKLYILNQDDVLRVHASSREENIESEVIGHVSAFHKTFFDWDPDQQQIKSTVDDSYYLADESAKKLYDSMVDNGFVTLIIGGNVVQRTEVDSVLLSGSRENPQFQFFGKLKLIKHKSLITKSLISKGSIDIVNRSPKNPHGMVIRNLSIIENKEISNKQKR